MSAGQDVIDRPDVAELEELARRARVAIVKAIAHAEGGHLGGPLSATDMLTALYWRVLNIRPDEPTWPERDRFVLSKGHSSIALYTVMALRGYFPLQELDTFDAIVVELKDDGSDVLYSSFIGGSGRDVTYGIDLVPGGT